MSKPTGKTYVIRTVLDFLQVPADRRPTMLAEFLSWLAHIEAIKSMTADQAQALGGYAHGFDLKRIEIPNECVWVDDGLEEARINVTTTDEETGDVIAKVTHTASLAVSTEGAD